MEFISADRGGRGRASFYSHAGWGRTQRRKLGTTGEISCATKTAWFGEYKSKQRGAQHEKPCGVVHAIDCRASSGCFRVRNFQAGPVRGLNGESESGSRNHRVGRRGRIRLTSGTRNAEALLIYSECSSPINVTPVARLHRTAYPYRCSWASHRSHVDKERRCLQSADASALAYHSSALFCASAHAMVPTA